MGTSTIANAAPFDACLLIGGERVETGARIAVYNPAHPDQLVGSIVRGTPEHVASAVRAASAAQPAWAAKTFVERADILARALDVLESGIEGRIDLLVRENGKTRAEAEGEMKGVKARARLTLDLAPQLDMPQELPAPSGRTFVRYVPYGVVVAIVPWNTPVSLAFLQVVPALMAGNSVVLKVPESCPLALTQTAQLLARALPAGLLNIVAGFPGDIGDAITMHPGVGKIAFTGSIASARKIIASACQTIKGMTAELGGNDAAIFLEDADLSEQTMQRLGSSVFRCAGQICMAVKRIYVSNAIRARFVEAFCDAVDRLTVGDGIVPGVTMGPLHTAAAKARALDLIENAQRQGACVHRLGRILDEKNFVEGHFVRPTVVTGIADDAPLMAEEQFCPVIPIAGFDTVDEAVARANATIFGLGGSVWAKDIEKAISIAQRLEAGTVFVNVHGTQAVNRHAPYGGLKQSGIGRRSGIDGVREYLQSQTLTTYEV